MPANPPSPDALTRARESLRCLSHDMCSEIGPCRLHRVVARIADAHAADQAALVDEQALKLRAADALARAVDQAVTAGCLGSRSSIADARLDYGDPHRYEAGEAAHVERLRETGERLVAYIAGAPGRLPDQLHELYIAHRDALAAVPATLRARAAAEQKVIEAALNEYRKTTACEHRWADAVATHKACKALAALDEAQP